MTLSWNAAMRDIRTLWIGNQYSPTRRSSPYCVFEPASGHDALQDRGLHRGGHVTCQEFVDRLLAWRDLELDARNLRAHDSHITNCRHCQAYLRLYVTTIKAVRASADDDVFEEVPEALVRSIVEGRRIH
jgi:hypothetical protein